MYRAFLVFHAFARLGPAVALQDKTFAFRLRVSTLACLSLSLSIRAPERAENASESEPLNTSAAISLSPYKLHASLACLLESQ
jgi:hypothetical protein